MNTPTLPKVRIETEAQDHAEETRYAVEHQGKELHPEPQTPTSKKADPRKASDTPWQVD